MLILTRKAGESIVVGNSIRITVVELSQGVVRLGFEAPSDVSIYRDEIFREIAAANQAALGGPVEDESAGPDLSKPVPPRKQRPGRQGRSHRSGRKNKPE